jgi:hypothetical protein
VRVFIERDIRHTHTHTHTHIPTEWNLRVLDRASQMGLSFVVVAEECELLQSTLFHLTLFLWPQSQKSLNSDFIQ